MTWVRCAMRGCPRRFRADADVRAVLCGEHAATATEAARDQDRMRRLAARPVNPGGTQ